MQFSSSGNPPDDDIQSDGWSRGISRRSVILHFQSTDHSQQGVGIALEVIVARWPCHLDVDGLSRKLQQCAGWRQGHPGRVGVRQKVNVVNTSDEREPEHITAMRFEIVRTELVVPLFIRGHLDRDDLPSRVRRLRAGRRLGSGRRYRRSFLSGLLTATRHNEQRQGDGGRGK